MKLLCFSDSHGDSTFMKRAILKNPDTDAIIYLGDGISDFDFIYNQTRGIPLYMVAGNCDRGYSLLEPPIKKSEILNLCGKRIFYTHGDLYNVKLGVEDLIANGIMNSYDIILFGHTHAPCEIFVDIENDIYKRIYSSFEADGKIKPGYIKKPIHLFNPGAISYSGGIPTFGIITLTEETVLFSHGSFR